MGSTLRILAAPDKFRGTLSATQAATAMVAAAVEAGHTGRAVPMADGGEGTLDVVGGANRYSVVTGPRGTPVNAGWRLDGRRAVIEMAEAAGLLLAGGAGANDPMTATTRGVGELITLAIAAGASEILVGLGGSATTDGGLGAVEALGWKPFGDIEVKVCADVLTRFTDAAAVFGPQKGASQADIEVLTGQLKSLAGRYRETFGLDVDSIPGSGAAGGLAGGLLALGGSLVGGFAALAELAELPAAVAQSDLVIVGEGKLDAGSFDGKVVGGVIELAAAAGVPVLVIVGQSEDRLTIPDHVQVLSLTQKFGAEAAFGQTATCISRAVAEYLATATAH